MEMIGVGNKPIQASQKHGCSEGESMKNSQYHKQTAALGSIRDLDTSLRENEFVRSQHRWKRREHVEHEE